MRLVIHTTECGQVNSGTLPFDARQVTTPQSVNKVRVKEFVGMHFIREKEFLEVLNSLECWGKHGQQFRWIRYTMEVHVVGVEHILRHLKLGFMVKKQLLQFINVLVPRLAAMATDLLRNCTRKLLRAFVLEGFGLHASALLYELQSTRLQGGLRPVQHGLRGLSLPVVRSRVENRDAASLANPQIPARRFQVTERVDFGAVAIVRATFIGSSTPAGRAGGGRTGMGLG